MNDPCNTAVYACTVITFYCIARLGEFTVPNICEKFEPTKYITHGDVSMLEDKDGLLVIKFRLPITKCEAMFNAHLRRDASRTLKRRCETIYESTRPHQMPTYLHGSTPEVDFAHYPKHKS